MGRDDDECTIMSPERCFFFGCGSSGWLDRCFDRTGAAVVVRVATRGVSRSGKRGPGAGGGLDSETGLRSAGAMAGGTSSSRGRLEIERGRRFGSGFKLMWVGMPP